MVMLTEGRGEHRSKPSNNRAISSTVLMLPPDSHTFPKMSNLSCGSFPYRLGESNATERRLKSWSLDRNLYLFFVRSALPSPANILTGSSSCLLKGKTPPVKGNWPGAFSLRIHSSLSPQSSVVGSATLGPLVPDSVS